MNNAITSNDWNKCFDSKDINTVANNFNTSFLNIAQEYIPNKVVQIRTKDTPWYTAELHKLK